MDLQEAIKLRILKLCEQNNITVNKLSTLSGTTQSTINNIVTGVSQNPKILTISNICLGLNIKLKDFFDDELFNDLEDN